jgi:hypothetical protein
MKNIDPMKMLVPDKSHMYASGYVERIEKHLNEFTDDLEDDETFLLKVLLNDGSIFIPTYFRYHNPHMVLVEGHDSNGNESLALLNQNDIQIIITKLKKSKTSENSENIEFLYQ